MFKHVVKVHPVENGEPNLCKVEFERDFDSLEYAYSFIRAYNFATKVDGNDEKAIYFGRINELTGELE